MMADPQRGWAWVDALVSAHTPKLMMTGPALIEPSLRTLCELCEDQLQVQRTKRLSPVEVAKHATTLERLEPGSLLVAFSRKLVLELKGMLESAGKSVSVVYGALSPEVRREQARRFREGEADIMVATDAVGMGLNLPAHTLCFYTDEKFDGIQNRQLKVQEVKQIGGRAGRFGHHDRGEITALDPQTLKSIRRLFNSPDAPVDLSQFQVRPSIDHLSAISELMGEPSLLRSWLTFNRNINYGEAFVSVLPDELAEWIELIDDPKIPLWLRWTFACTPIRGGFDSPASQHAQRWIKRVAEGHAIPMPRLLLGRPGQSGKHAARGGNLPASGPQPPRAFSRTRRWRGGPQAAERCHHPRTVAPAQTTGGEARWRAQGRPAALSFADTRGRRARVAIIAALPPSASPACRSTMPVA